MGEPVRFLVPCRIVAQSLLSPVEKQVDISAAEKLLKIISTGGSRV
jgi:hypothetical protein